MISASASVEVPEGKRGEMETIKKDKWGVRSKVWIEWEGRPVMGEGRMAMLQAIERCGSIINASRETGISYRKIRGAIRDMENILSRPLVRAFRGGEGGGGAELTETAHELLGFFEKFSDTFQQEADARFQEHFK